MVAKMRNAGEACTAANRFYVHADVAESFSAKLAERMSAMTVGPGTDDARTHPLVDHVRGRGLLLGVVLREPAAKNVETAARDAGP